MGKMMLTTAERDQLGALARRRTVGAAYARRAKLILLLEDGETRQSIMSKLECDSRFISRWAGRFLEERLAGMYARHPGRAPQQPPAKLEARVLNHTLKRKPRDGSTHWSSRKLAEELGDVSFSTVQRIWRTHGIRPHRLDRHMVSNDPDFETKAADVIGLYLNPPAHAAVFCVDEKTAIQALDRKDRMLPLSPGRAQSHGFEYKRNGTLSLFAALNTATGRCMWASSPAATLRPPAATPATAAPDGACPTGRCAPCWTSEKTSFPSTDGDARTDTGARPRRWPRDTREL